MNPLSFRFSKSSSRLLAASLGCLALGGACSNDDPPPPTPTTFGVEVTSLDGRAVDEEVPLRCDRGGPSSTADVSAGGAAAASASYFSTLVVAVATTPVDAAQQFVLRPAHACGASTRCGYVRIEGLDDNGAVVASVDTATAEGVLELDLARLPSQIRVSLIRGVDQRPLQNPDQTDVTSSVTPSFIVPTCAELPGGGGQGAGGQGGAGEAGAGPSDGGGAGPGPAGGAGGEGGGAPAGGAGGELSETPGGAAGQASAGGAGGA